MLTLSFAYALLAILALFACDRKAAPRKPTVVLSTSLKLARKATMAYGHSVKTCNTPSYYRLLETSYDNPIATMQASKQAMRLAWQDYRQLSASLA